MNSTNLLNVYYQALNDGYVYNFQRKGVGFFLTSGTQTATPSVVEIFKCTQLNGTLYKIEAGCIHGTYIQWDNETEKKDNTKKTLI